MFSDLRRTARTGGIAARMDRSCGRCFENTLGCWCGRRASKRDVGDRDMRTGRNLLVGTLLVVAIAVTGASALAHTDNATSKPHTALPSYTSYPMLRFDSADAPENDAFVNAIAIAGASGTTAGTNDGATEEANEPLTPGSTAIGKTVWWRWIAPAGGSYRIDTRGSSIDTVLAVYTGSSVGSRSQPPVAANDDSFSDGTSLVTFVATQGVTYRIQVGSCCERLRGGPLVSTGCPGPSTTTSATPRCSPAHRAPPRARVWVGHSRHGEPISKTRSTAPSGSRGLRRPGRCRSPSIQPSIRASPCTRGRLSTSSPRSTAFRAKARSACRSSPTASRPITSRSVSSCLPRPGRFRSPTEPCPERRRLATATPGDRFVSLSWSVPASNGGAPITGYRVYRGTSSGDETCSRHWTMSPATRMRA